MRAVAPSSMPVRVPYTGEALPSLSSLHAIHSLRPPDELDIVEGWQQCAILSSGPRHFTDVHDADWTVLMG